jgi:hypothetical protein
MREVVNADQKRIFCSDTPQAFVEIEFFNGIDFNIVLLHELNLIRFSFPYGAITIVEQLKFL